VYAVLGNHDHWHGVEASSRALAAAGIHELTNTGVWLESGSERLRLAGVDDLWTGFQDIDKALADAAESDACIVLSHNPDYAETLRDPRVSLVLSGHTHGGQAVFPVIGAPIVPSDYGQKYVRGLVQAPMTQVYISRGLGTITPPLRFCCRPEISLLTLE
jgi:predicted MPP superfamily phosphohydrolase